jgi:outer membrane receptor protein involved in Fe transport
MEATTGNGFASFLLGVVDSSTVFHVTTTPGYRFDYFASFFQDDYRATQKLTLSLGLRYEVSRPLREVDDRLTFFSPTTPNPGVDGRPGALVFMGNGPGRLGIPTIVQTALLNFGPRAGIAYRLTPKTVLRAGYGIFYGLGGHPRIDFRNFVTQPLRVQVNGARDTHTCSSFQEIRLID